MLRMLNRSVFDGKVLLLLLLILSSSLLLLSLLSLLFCYHYEEMKDPEVWSKLVVKLI